jgi:hypothetical protein
MRSVPFLVADNLTFLILGYLVIQAIALYGVVADLELGRHSTSRRSDSYRLEFMRIDVLQPIKMSFAFVGLVAIPKAVLGKQFLCQANQPQIIVKRFVQPE